jgi:hypothetical protein
MSVSHPTHPSALPPASANLYDARTALLKHAARDAMDYLE